MSLSVINKIRLFSIVAKSRKYTKKSIQDPNKFSLQFRNDFLVKKIKKVFKVFNVNLSVKGYENLGNGPAILVGNHQDNIDALTIIYALKKQSEDKSEDNKIATFIAKHSLQYKSSTRYPLSVIDTFFLDRDDLKKSLETYNEFGKFVKENKTFGVIFAEGSRNREGSVSPFKPGVFKIAKKELLPIIPFTINNSVSGFDSKRDKTLNIEVIFHKKIPASSVITQNTIAISERVFNIVFNSFKKPEYQFKDTNVNIEESKSAIKWNRKQNKKIAKEAKKARQEREQERKLIEAEEKEILKYEKYRARKEAKRNRKKGIKNNE